MLFDNTEHARALAQLPPEAAPNLPPDRSAWGAPWRAVQAAVADVLGSTADVLKGYGSAGAIAAQADPVARAALGDAAIDAGAAEGRAQIAADDSLASDVGRSFRNVSASLRPDPATASDAERIVFGFIRPAAKLVAGAVAGGPIGAGFAAAEEGFTTSEDLRQQGVDLPTRTAVAGLTAASMEAGAVLPIVGSTNLQTLGLYLAGGPGGFVAQQAATKAILEHADYPEIAKQYDPLDPIGLAMSALIPLPFAAHGVRANLRSAREVDAAMAHNLSLAQDAAEHRAATETPPAPTEESRIAPRARPEPELPGSESAPAPTTPADDIAALKQRMTAMEQENPNVASHMEAVRKQIAEDAGGGLGSDDAALLKVAAECALAMA